VKRYLPIPVAPAGIWSAKHADHGYGQSASPDWREIDWLEHSHEVEIDGALANYVDLGSGDGPPAVFVHGLGGQWQNWLENIPRVATRRRAIAVDLPGFGLSEKPRDEITISGYGRFVRSVLEHLGIERAHLIGNSMGGFVASEVAIQFPEIVDRLVLVSAAGISTASVARAPVLALARVGTAVTTFTAARHKQLMCRPITRHGALLLVVRHPSLIAPDLAYEGLVKGTGKPGFDDALRASLKYDYRERLPDVKQPTLIVWGEQDSILPVQDAHEYERLISDSRKVVMQDTGHVPMLERPSAFNEMLMDFLAETGPAEERESYEGESERV
jgi:pimeloyl-ACP methyl ester carboxylesterase